MCVCVFAWFKFMCVQIWVYDGFLHPYIVQTHTHMCFWLLNICIREQIKCLCLKMDECGKFNNKKSGKRHYFPRHRVNLCMNFFFSSILFILTRIRFQDTLWFSSVLNRRTFTWLNTEFFIIFSVTAVLLGTLAVGRI